MVEYKKGYFARSKAGHDKGKIYIIIEETYTAGKEETVLVADGDVKLLSKPKKKKTKHLQVIKQCDPVLEDRMTNGFDITDEDIKRAISEYLNK